jgi:uncharacterized protein (TIGR03435 family)
VLLLIAILLQLGVAGTNKLKVSPWPASITQGTYDPFRFVDMKTQPLTALVSFLENEMNRPVIDRTGLTNFFDLVLKWNRFQEYSTTSRARLKQAIHDQFGLDLVETNQLIEMLVVEKVK